MAISILGLLAETPIHPGVGRNLGVIDLPVAREAATDYPVLVGSSLKGALRDFVGIKEKQEKLFGQCDEAGQVLVSDARILLLPVRSLSGQYRWVTCPLILERLSRDKKRAGLATNLAAVAVKDGEASATEGTGKLYLEEREFTVGAHVPKEVVDEIKGLIGNENVANRVSKQLVVLSNNDFAWFARYGLSVQARNVLDKDTKTSKNLWYEETLPPDTLMYALLSDRNDKSLNELCDLLRAKPYLQAGGNETIGQGVFLVSLMQKGAAQ